MPLDVQPVRAIKETNVIVVIRFENKAGRTVQYAFAKRDVESDVNKTDAWLALPFWRAIRSGKVSGSVNVTHGMAVLANRIRYVGNARVQMQIVSKRNPMTNRVHVAQDVV